MNDYERRFEDFDRSVLAALLTGISSRPEQAAMAVLEHFPSFQHATRADQIVLAQIIGEDGARLLRTIPNAVASMTRKTALKTASYLLTIEASKVHFSALLNGRRNEAFAVIYLNAKNRIIEEDVWEGSVDRASIYPREIMRRVILLDAFGVLIAHNHPSGDPTPSPCDVRETLHLEKALDVFDVILLDHFIFGEGEPFSLKANGYF